MRIGPLQGRARPPAGVHSARLGHLFATPIGVLVDHGRPKQARKRSPVSQLQRSIERISDLPEPKQKFVIEMLETVLAQADT